MIPEWVNNYIGIDFVEHGRDHAGCDCWGLIKLVLKEQYNIDNLIDLKKEEYNTWEREKLSKIFKEEAKNWIEIKSPEAGDIVLLRMVGMPVHVGVVIKPPWMLHCEYKKGTAIECYERAHWKNRIEGFYRHVGRK